MDQKEIICAVIVLGISIVVGVIHLFHNARKIDTYELKPTTTQTSTDIQTTTTVKNTTTSKETSKKAKKTKKKTTTTTTTSATEYVDYETPAEETITDDYVEPETELIETEQPIEYYGDYSPYDLMSMGVISWGGYRYTYYSELVLPGDGLAIEGRHVDEYGFICDGEGYICVASGSLPWGSVVNTPFGKMGKVYDCGCDWDVIDCYVSW